MHLVIAQLHVLQQHLPRLAGGLRLFRRVGGRRCVSGFGLGLDGFFGRLAGEQFLPVELAIGFQGGPGFQLLAADLAHHHLLLGQVHGGVGDVQSLEFCQWPAIRGLDGKRRDTDRDVAQQQFGLLGQIELVVGAQADNAVFQHQRHGVAHIRPEGFHLAVGDFQRAFGGDRDEAEVTGPIDLPAIGPDGHQGHVGAVFGQGAEVFQLEVQFVVDEFDGFAGALVQKVHGTARQVDTLDAQWKRLGVGIGRRRFTRRQFEQAQQVELAVLVEKNLGLGFVQFDVGQVKRLGPQAVELQIGVQTLEADLFLARLANGQAPQRHFKAERVEFDSL
ncbi:hypothetical protein D3C73_812680 [compost metagenome]